MRRLFLFLCIAIIGTALWFVFHGVGISARKEISDRLTGMGFSDVNIGDVSLHARSATASDITLEKTGIDKIDAIDVERGWLNIFSSNAGTITVVSPDIYRTFDHVNDLLPGLMMLGQQNLAALPDGKIVVQNGRLNIASPLGLFQFLFDVVIEPYKGGKRAVTAHIKSTEETMVFASDWRGWIAQDGTILMDALIPEIKTHIGPVRVTRGNGWLSLASAGKYPALRGQIESGGASFNSIPLQNFSLTLDAGRDAFTFLSRAQATGAPETSFAADIAMQETQKEIAFTLSSGNLPAFFHYLENISERPVAPLLDSFKNKKTVELHIDYQMEKRFPDGPYPFDMRGITGDDEFLSGTFLIYPGTFDMRGSAKVDHAYLPGITQYFKLSDNAVSGDYIRMDASLAPFVSGIGAGVKDHLGKGP